MKTNIQDTGRGISDLMNIQVKDYEFTTEGTGKRHTGFIAQQLINIYPDAVHVPDDPNKMWSVDYGKITPLIVRSVQQHQEQIEGIASTLGLVGGNISTTSAQLLNLNDDLSSITSDLSLQSTQLSTINTNVSTLNTSVSSVSDEIIKLKDVDASMSAELARVRDNLETSVASLSAELEELRGQVLGISGTASPSGTLFTPDQVATLSALTVTGKTNVYDLGVTGKITAGLMTIDGLEGEIYTLTGPLKLQPLALGSLEVMGGKIEVDTSGNIKLKEGDLILEKGKIVGNDDMRGTENIPAGQTSITVTKTWTTKPKSITVTAGFDSYVWIENIDTTGFTIKIKNPPSVESPVYWTAIW
jgi:uncharacterized protein YoxC